MVRRSFRLGLRCGVLVGIVFALYKIMQSRRTPDDAGSSAPAGDSWDRDSTWTPPPPPVAQPSPPPPTEPSVAPPAAQGAVAAVDPGLGAELVDFAAPDPAPPSDPAPAAETNPAPAARTPARAQPARRAAPAAPAAKTAKAAKATKATRARQALPAEVWVEPTGSTCPASHPVKAKLASRLFHLPGMFAYDRTRPDRCYSGADTAIADGFVQAKR